MTRQNGREAGWWSSEWRNLWLIAFACSVVLLATIIAAAAS